MNLEKEIDSYWNKITEFQPPFAVLELKKKDLAEVAKHFVEWQKQQDQQTIELAEDHAMLAGMMKEREQMLKDAVNAYVYESSNPVSESGKTHQISIIYEEQDSTPHILSGDKVKLIIIKDEEQ